MSDIFCKIIAGEIKSELVAEDTDWIAINDIRPKAPVHILVIPKKHVELQDVSTELAGNLLVAARTVAEKVGVDKTGFRVIINHGEHGGQEVPHLHLHILGGRKL
ncbi:MAG: histidine triad nucleotide-binding protein [Patescibacteria group bacterium]